MWVFSPPMVTSTLYLWFSADYYDISRYIIPCMEFTEPLDLCWCLSLILDISWPLSLHLFLHTLSSLLSSWDSDYTYIRWFDINLQISDDFPSIFSLFVFSLDTFHLAVFKFSDAFLLNPSNEFCISDIVFLFLGFNYVCMVTMFLLKFPISSHMSSIFSIRCFNILIRVKDPNW